MSPTTALILYAASLVGGIIIARRRHRWLDTALCLLLGPLGFLFAIAVETSRTAP